MSRDRIAQVTLEAIKAASKDGQESIAPETVMKTVTEKLGAKRDLSVQRAVLACWNELLRKGDLSLGQADGVWSVNHCFVTDSGKATLNHTDRDPMNESGYLTYLRKETILDSVTSGYVTEALATYRATCFKATAVLIGAAVENLVLNLRDELVKRLSAAGLSVAADLKSHKARTVVEAIAKRILPDLKADARKSNDEATRKLSEDADSRLTCVAAEFRKTRNDAGHPASLDPVDPADVHANLLLFPSTAKLLARLKTWIIKYYV
jgi:hypothetical protein